MEIRTFDTTEEMLAAVGKDQETADEAAASDPETYEVGDYFMRFMPEMHLVIYGEILDPVATNREAGGDETETEYLRKQYALPHMKHQRWTRCFSSLMSKGELGNTHTSSINAKLSKEEFERAREAKWPSDRTGVLAVFGTQSTGNPSEPIEA